MSASNDESNKKKRTLDKILQDEVSNLQHVEHVKKLKQTEAAQYKISAEKSSMESQKTRTKTQQEYQKVLRSLTESHMQHTHTSNVASLIMDSESRLNAIICFMAGKIRERLAYGSTRFGQETGFWGMPARSDGASFIRRLPQQAWDNMKYYCSKPNPEDIPIRDLKYFTNVSEDGVLTQAWADTNITDLFCDENGNQIPGKVEAFQALLQEAVAEWVETIDEDGGYFIVDHGNSEFRLYNKTQSGVESPAGSGIWVLNEEEVLKHYASEHCHDQSGKFIPPKPNAPTLPGKEHLYVTSEKFVKLRDESSKPLGEFLETHFSGVDLEAADENETRLGM
ncbi:MAG: hypothetical protein Q8R24_05325 [Legionellaceae bacterium]|nr:hypothetical protein [Legionellaceae bacterium]